jgi:hypothetical protein
MRIPTVKGINRSRSQPTQCLELVVAALGLAAVPAAHAADWSAQAYDLYFGDFNGDGKTDVLYIAKDPAGISGIDLSDGNGPNIPLQSWASNYLNIAWSGNRYTVIVADFNGDGRADILLQSNTPGDSYLLQANPQGKFVGITQTIANTTAGVTWSADQHHIVAGDFNNDGKADLFLQETSPAGLNAVMFADGNGTFTATAPGQSWSDGFLGLKWATPEAKVYTGNFDGLNGADLLVQARPLFVLIDYDVPFPVPTYPANLNGVLLSQPSSPVFQLAGLKAWSRNGFGVDWSPLTSNVVVGDFNGDGTTDVLLQGKSAGKASYLLTGNASGAAFASGALLAPNVIWTADNYRLSSVNFAGSSSGAGVYFQGLSAATPNIYANVVTGATVATVVSSPVLVTNVVEYSYDALGRLVTVTRTGAVGSDVQTGYAYDAAGNRQSVTSTSLP